MSNDTRQALPPMEQLIGFVDWERKNNPGKKHVAEWALAEIERLQAALAAQPVAGAVAQMEFAGWQQRYIDPQEGPSSWQPCRDSDVRLLQGRSDYELRKTYAAPKAAQET